MRVGFMLATVFVASPMLVRAQEEPKPLPPIDISAIVPAPIEKVWAAFATTEGVKAWMVKQADIDMKVGGLWKTKYGAEGHLGDERTIVNEVLAFDPGRMFSIRIHKPPTGFPFMNTYRDMWTVVYFDPIEGGKTKVTLRAHGFKDVPESKQLRTFFEAGNKQTLDGLVKHFQPKSLEGTVREVEADGTLHLKVGESTERVRLWGVNLDGPSRPADRIRQLVVGQKVRVAVHSLGREGLVVGEVRCRNATFLYEDVDSGNIGHILVRDGAARPTEEGSKDEALVKHAGNAKAARRGLWARE